MVDIEHGLLNVTNLMTENVYGHHWKGRSVRLHVFRVGIVNAQILPEAQSLRLQPRFLQFYQDEFLISFGITDSGTEINTEYRQIVVSVVTIFMRANLYSQNIHLQQGRQDGTGYALVFHHVLKHYIINRISNFHISSLVFIRVQK